MACMPSIRRHKSYSSQYVAAMPELFWASAYDSVGTEKLYFEIIKWRLMELSILLKRATCYDRIVMFFG